MRKLPRRGAMRVSAQDGARLQAAVLALHSHRNLEGFRRAVAGIFMDLVPADYFSLGDGRIDLAKRSFQVLNIWESRPVRLGALREAFVRTIFEHPFVLYFMQHGPPEGALILSDFLTLPQLRRTRFYQESLLPANFGRLISIGSVSGPGLATLTLARPASAPDFSERDRRMVELLQPHFDLARTNIERESLARASRTRSLSSAGLTPREIEVALWLAQGKTNPETALILDGPVRTIEKHVERILRKLGVDNRVEAAVTIAEIVHG
jgi:DNA-binding CsgD family transcriptional regulator